jgi:hypothetical protein
MVHVGEFSKAGKFAGCKVSRNNILSEIPTVIRRKTYDPDRRYRFEVFGESRVIARVWAINADAALYYASQHVPGAVRVALSPVQIRRFGDLG